MCILQRARFESCLHFCAHLIATALCPLAHDYSLYLSSEPGPDGKTMSRATPLPVTSGCFESPPLNENTEILILPGLCVTCSYQAKHKVGSMTFRVGDSVRNLSPKDLSERGQFLHSLPLSVRFGAQGDLSKLGQKLRVNVELDSEARLAEVYNSYIQGKEERRWSSQSLPMPKPELEITGEELAQNATKRLALMSEAKYGKHLQKQEEESRESAKYRGLDILTIAQKHQEKHVVEDEVEGVLCTQGAMIITDQQLSKPALKNQSSTRLRFEEHRGIRIAIFCQDHLLGNRVVAPESVLVDRHST